MSSQYQAGGKREKESRHHLPSDLVSGVDPGRRGRKKIGLSPRAGLIFFLCLFSALVFAQEEENWPPAELELDTIIVVGDEILSERALDNPTAFVTVIDVRDSPGRMETIGEVLEKTVGVKINRLGGLGSFATVSIRGSSANQVQIYLDGVPLNRALTGVTNLEDLPLDSLAYIEVFRGFTPPDFGQAGIGGVINLVTRKSLETRASAVLSWGSFETYKAEAMAAVPAGPLRTMLFVSATGSRGDFSYKNENGTPAIKHDDFTDHRRNNDFRAIDLITHFSLDRGEWELETIASLHEKDQSLPGMAAVQAEKAGLDTTRYGVNLSARNRSLRGGNLDLTFAADWLSDTQIYDDPKGELGVGSPRKNENRMTTAGTRLKVAWRLPELNSRLTGFVEYRQESYVPVEHLPSKQEGKEQSRTLLAYVFQAEMQDPSQRLTLQTTLRQEHYWNEIEGDPLFANAPVAGENQKTLVLFSPSFGFQWRRRDALVLKGNAGRYYRVPTFYELFGERGVAVGNTDLKPESGFNYDVGFLYTGEDKGIFHRPYVEYAFFQSWVEDMIIFFQNSQRTIKPINLGAAVVSGHELSFGTGLGKEWVLSGNYTFQAPVDQGEVPHWRGNQLPHRPIHEAFIKLEYQPLSSLSLWGEFNYISGNYWDRANVFEVDDRHIYNAGVSLGLYRRQNTAVRLTLEGKNLADEKIADVAGYPLPGASWFVTLEAKW